ncbi:MAG: energy-dependent translational throttle protein EttA [Planctomycetota bacterium]|nr:MAG: energy-dependent translational throttle protein EttA [Planctomycetota bacterium]
MSPGPDKELALQVIQVRKFYDRTEVLRPTTLGFYADAKIGVIGPNGSGKSTLLRILAGEDQDFEGRRILAEGKTVGYVPQEPQLDPDKTVKALLDEAVAHVHKTLDRYNDICTEMGEVEGEALEKLSEEFERLQAQIDAHNMWEVDRQLEVAAQALHLPPMDRLFGVLSGGEKRRVAMCRTLIEQPDIVLLDEPTNHLDAQTVEWLEHHLANYPGLVVLVTHDRYFLDNVVTWMLEMERGVGTPYEGNYSTYLAEKEKRLASGERSDQRRQKRMHKELEWLRQTPKARMKKNKARLKRYEQLVEEQKTLRPETIDLVIPSGPHLGNRVLEVEGVSKSFGDQVLLQDFSFTVPPGAIIGVVGANGTGKSTLMKMISGKEQADQGTLQLGPTVELCYVDQTREALRDQLTVWEDISDGLEFLPFGGGEIQSRAYVSRFNFKGSDQEKKVGELSGGQRNRVLLAKMLRVGGNFILLDEPTNDLDLVTLRVLEEAIDHFAGSMMVVSHDRYFLDRVCTHIIAFEGEGEVYFHLGTYTEYAEWRAEMRSNSGKAPESKASKHRKLTL